MMKKNRVLFSFVVVVAAVFLFTSASTSLDGRAVVAESGDLPEGLFAKTVGYLPGDSISVTNMVTRRTIDVLVIGALDASEGVAILLSQEAASELGVIKDTNTVVKITKRSDELDKVFTGSAVVARGDGDYLPNQVTSEFLPSASGSISDNDMFTESFVDDDTENYTPQYSYVDESAPQDFVSSDAPVSFSPSAIEYIMGGYPAYPEPVANNYLSENYSEEIANLPSTEKEAVYVDTFDDYNYPPISPQETETVYDEIPAEPEYAASERFVDSYPEPEPEFLSSVPEYVDEVVEEAYTPAVPIEKFVPENLANDYVSEKFNDNSYSDNIASITDGEETYEPIVLVPSEPHPPVASVNSIVNPIAANELKNINPPVNLNSAAASVSNYSDSSYTVSNMRSLESGKYYVQIASSDDSKAVKTVLARYSQNYPMVVVPTSSNSAMQIMVGPLSVDEYEVVMARFKSYGFNDAFYRKIK